MILNGTHEGKEGTVISIDFSNKADPKKSNAAAELDQVVLANRRNLERLRKEREAANRSVLRTYRIRKNEKK